VKHNVSSLEDQLSRLFAISLINAHRSGSLLSSKYQAGSESGFLEHISRRYMIPSPWYNLTSVRFNRIKTRTLPSTEEQLLIRQKEKEKEKKEDQPSVLTSASTPSPKTAEEKKTVKYQTASSSGTETWLQALQSLSNAAIEEGRKHQLRQQQQQQLRQQQKVGSSASSPKLNPTSPSNSRRRGNTFMKGLLNPKKRLTIRTPSKSSFPTGKSSFFLLPPCHNV
jgi:hypothetical protein